MLATSRLIPFLLTVYVLILIPGPSVMFTVSRGVALGRLATLGAICVLVALLSDGCWALASGSARRWLGRSRKRLEWMSAGGGTIMVALGVGLALTGRKR